jgi:release factor glutamine methyltransferase
MAEPVPGPALVAGGTSACAALREAACRLEAAGVPPGSDGPALLCHVLEAPRHLLLAHPETTLGEAQVRAFRGLVARRAAGEPLAYLTGRREFWSLDLVVTPATLVPRPDTERLVEIALDGIPPGASWRVADLGTGSGAIALAIANDRPRCHVLATDLSARALDVARDNARRLGLDERVEFRLGDWCSPLGEEVFDVIVSNPPYVPDGHACLETDGLRFEPRRALGAGADGLDAIRRICRDAGPRLCRGGRLVLEHGHDQGDRVTGLLGDAGYRDVHLHRDHGGRQRVSEGRTPEASS